MTFRVTNNYKIDIGLGTYDRIESDVTFLIDNYETLYDGPYIRIVWNGLYKQPQFVIKIGLSNSLIQGGFKILNNTENSTKVFSYNYVENLEAFFSSSTGLEADVDESYNISNTWNRCELWISSVTDSKVPYHDIKLHTNGNKGFLNVVIKE